IGWTQMNPGGLLHDASKSEVEAIELGMEAFASRHAGVQLFPDPFFAPRVLHPASPVANLIIVPGDGDLLSGAAKKLAAAIAAASGAEVAIKPASELGDGLETNAPLVLLGTSADNLLSRQILRRFQLGI